MAVTEVSQSISFILQRGSEDSGWTTGSGGAPLIQTFCRKMDCWAACSAMLRGYPGGTEADDAHAIDRIRTEYVAWARNNQPVDPNRHISYPGDNGLSGGGVDDLCRFLGHGVMLVHYTSPAPALRDALGFLGRGPMMLFNNVLNHAGQPGGNHVTILYRARVTTAGALGSMTDAEALSAELFWADPWPAFERRPVIWTAGHRGYNGQQTTNPPRLYYDGAPDSARHSGTFQDYLHRFSILAWSIAPLPAVTHVAPNSTTTVAHPP